MAIRRGIVCLVFLATAFAKQPFAKDGDLARALADPDQRAAAVAALEAEPLPRTRLLMKWTVSPPRGVDPYELKIGLADAFGALHTKEAIPFLVKNIGLDRTDAANTWMKSPEVLERRLAACTALIRIGPDAAVAVDRTWHTYASYMDRLAAIFVVAKIPDYKWREESLNAKIREAELEARWARRGLNGFAEEVRKPAPSGQ